MVRPLPLVRLGNEGDKDRRSNPQGVKTLLLHRCALRKFHVIGGQTTGGQMEGKNGRDQITFYAFHSFLVEVQNAAGYVYSYF